MCNKDIKIKTLKSKIAQLERKLEEVTEKKHWNECRQISAYDMELKELREELKNLKAENRLLRRTILIANDFFDACANVLKPGKNPLDNIKKL